MRTVTVSRPAQAMQLQGPDFIVRLAAPALIVRFDVAELTVRVQKRGQLTAEESAILAASGGEAQFYAAERQLDTIINSEMPEYFGPYTE